MQVIIRASEERYSKRRRWKNIARVLLGVSKTGYLKPNWVPMFFGSTKNSTLGLNLVPGLNRI